MIRIASVALPKSPMNLAQGDEVPQIITRNAPAAPRIFDTICKATFATQSGVKRKSAVSSQTDAIDPKATLRGMKFVWTAVRCRILSRRRIAFTLGE